VDNLKLNSAYNFHVIACNEYGHGPASKESETVIFGAQVPGLPSEVEVKPSGATGAHMQWQPPNNDGGMPVDRYQVSVSEDTATSKWIHYSVTEPGVVIDDLKPRTPYIFAVSAGNGVGYGPMSEEIEWTTGTNSKHRTDLFILLWVGVEVVLVIVIVSAIAFIWRQRKTPVNTNYLKFNSDHNEEEEDSYLMCANGDKRTDFFQVQDVSASPNGYNVKKMVTIEAVLQDINGRIEFRESCETCNHLDYFNFFQVVEDFRQCESAELEMRAREILRWYLLDGAERKVSIHKSTVELLCIALDEERLSQSMFVQAQQEVVTVMEIFVFPHYLEVRHKLVAVPPENIQPLPCSQLPQKVTALAFNRAVLGLQDGSKGYQALQSRCNELNCTEAMEFVFTIERFRHAKTGALPSMAHDIVETHMASNSRAYVKCSLAVQQELINTHKPHNGMFDNAQKEVLHAMKQILCPHVLPRISTHVFESR